mgnify:CR=1 FL=1
MKEISLHILDIVQNSIKAKASLIQLKVLENTFKNQLIITIEDDGKGMDKEFLEKVTSPFITTRTTRKVGLGISLLKAAAERCGGRFQIDSSIGIGTKVEACFQYNHIDRAPLGNMVETLISIILSLGNNTELIYFHSYNDGEFNFDTREIRDILGDKVLITEGEVLDWIRNYMEEGLKKIYGGVGN